MPLRALPLLSFLLLICIGGAAARAQEIVSPRTVHQPQGEAKEALPNAPADMVVDMADLFTAEERTALSAKLVDFREKHGFHLYVVAYTYIYGEDANQRAMRLGYSWLANKYGAVVVWDKGAPEKRGSGPLGYACTQEETRFFTTTMLAEMVQRANAAAQARKDASGAQRVIAAMDQLQIEFLALKPMLEENRRLVSRQHWQVFGYVAAAMAISLLLLIAARRTQRTAERKKLEVYRFPDVEVAPRFGAPHGGGVIGHIDFRQ